MGAVDSGQFKNGVFIIDQSVAECQIAPCSLYNAPLNTAPWGGGAPLLTRPLGGLWSEAVQRKGCHLVKGQYFRTIHLPLDTHITPNKNTPLWPSAAERQSRQMEQKHSRTIRGELKKGNQENLGSHLALHHCVVCNVGDKLPPGMWEESRADPFT